MYSVTGLKFEYSISIEQSGHETRWAHAKESEIGKFKPNQAQKKETFYSVFRRWRTFEAIHMSNEQKLVVFR